MDHETPRHAVLIIDDEKRMRELLTGLVTRLGYDPEATASAESATRMLRQRTRDIVLLDLHLPGMSGMEFLESLRQNWPNMQVIIVTGFGDLKDAKTAIRNDVVDFVTKPFDLGELEVSLSRASARIRALNEKPQRGEIMLAISDEVRETYPPGTKLHEIEKDVILRCMQRHDGNRTETARELGISRRTLYNKLAQYELGY